MTTKIEDIRAKWESLTPEEREAVIKWVNETFGQLTEALNAVVAWMAQLCEMIEKEARRT